MRRAIRFSLTIALLLAFSVSAGSFNAGPAVPCASSGNKVVSSTSIPATWWIVMASTNNTGKVYVGGSSVTTSTGVYLNAGDSLSAPPHGGAPVYNLNQVYIACTTSADGITFIYQQ